MEDQFEHAKALHNEDRLDDAVNAYLQLLQSEPENFKAHNNLGTVYEDQDKFADAVGCYRRALEINPDAAPVHYNLGHALQRQSQFEAAIDAYQAVLALRPDSPSAYYNIGHAHHDLGDLAAAERAYRKAIEGDPELYRAHSNLGTVLFDQSRLPEAAAEYSRAIEIKPNSAPDHYNLGRVWEVQGKFEDAAEAFRESLGINPLSSAAYSRLATMQIKLQKPEDAANVFRQWLFLMPDDPVALHMQAAFRGDQSVRRASDGYVRDTFDGFAADFDKRLARLDYRAPDVIARSLQQIRGAPSGDLNVLDIGCGTGLCGTHLRSYAKHLSGVDISSAMLEKAREGGEYDDLTEAELTGFMIDNPDDYDLIVAADVLIYFGDLQPVFEAAENALRMGGHLLFSLEHLDDAESASGYFLNPHGRYSHTQKYVRQTLERAGLTVLDVAVEALRMEDSQPVDELVVIAMASDSEAE